MNAIETLGDAWIAGWKVHVACAHGKRVGMRSMCDCIWRAKVDFETLAATRGRVFPITGLAQFLKCPLRLDRNPSLFCDAQEPRQMKS